MSAPARLARLRERLAENRCVVHGPVPSGEAAALVAARAVDLAAGAAVAVPTGDVIVSALDVAGALAGCGARLLRPDDPRWAEELADAGVGVTGALAAVAATGTLVLGCGPGAPRGTSLVPAAHVCAVRVDDVVESVADAVARLAAAPLPSAVSWVGGPSRTGDLEMVTTFGVHGPVAVEVVLVEGLAPAP